MNITYGCECRECGNHPSDQSARVPCAWVVERNGRVLNVCTKCLLSRDRQIARLFDVNTPSDPFLEYDSLGLLVMLAGLAGDKRETES